MRVLFRHLFEPAVVYASFTVGGHQSKLLDLAETTEKSPEFGLKLFDGPFWHKTDHLEDEDRLVALIPFLKHRFAPVLELPVPVDLREPGPCLLAKAYQLKHLLEVSVPAVTYAAFDRLSLRQSHQARVPKPEEIGTFDHED